jgi:hypothetical protein
LPACAEQAVRQSGTKANVCCIKVEKNGVRRVKLTHGVSVSIQQFQRETGHTRTGKVRHLAKCEVIDRRVIRAGGCAQRDVKWIAAGQLRLDTLAATAFGIAINVWVVRHQAVRHSTARV